MIATVLTTVQRDPAGRIAVGVVRLGLALMSSGVALLPSPSRANLAALHAAAIDSPPGSVAPTTALIGAARVGHHVPAPNPAQGLPSRRGPGLYRPGVSASPGGVALTPGLTA